jgi:hypothetical protein
METPSGDKGRLGGKFEGYTHTPKEDMWARIAAGQTGAQGAGRLAGLFAAYQHKPHARVWRAIAHTLQPQRRRIVLLSWSVAASLALLLGWGFYQWQSAPEDGTSTAATAFAAHKTSLPTSHDRVVNCGQPVIFDWTNLYNPSMEALTRSFNLYKSAFVGHVPMAQPDWALPGNGVPQAPTLLPDGPSPVRDSSAIAVQLVTPIDSFITEVFPEIEIPQGDEAENALALGLSSGFLPANGGYARTYRSEAYQDNGDAFQDQGTGFNSGPVLSNNSGSLGVPEDYQTPLSIGFFADLPLSRRWSVGLGTSYTVMRSIVPDGSRATRQYAGLGTRATFAFINGKDARCYALSGLQADFGIDASFQAIPGSRVVATDAFKAGNHLSVQLGTGVDFSLTPRLGLYGQFAATAYLLQSHANLWTQRALWPTTQVGLRLKL